MLLETPSKQEWCARALGGLGRAGTAGPIDVLCYEQWSTVERAADRWTAHRLTKGQLLGLINANRSDWPRVLEELSDRCPVELWTFWPAVN